MKGCAASRLLRAATCGALILGLSGCASTGGDPRDPLEPMNRAVYKFNEKFDEVLARPVAEAYRDFVPSVVRTGVGNFFSNIGDIVIGINDLLQGKMTEAINDFGRVMVNTTLGVCPTSSYCSSGSRIASLHRPITRDGSSRCSPSGAGRGVKTTPSSLSAIQIRLRSARSSTRHVHGFGRRAPPRASHRHSLRAESIRVARKRRA